MELYYMVKRWLNRKDRKIIMARLKKYISPYADPKHNRIVANGPDA